MVPEGALMLTEFVIVFVDLSAIKFPEMTTSPLLVVTVAGLTPAAIWSVDETRTFPAMGVPAIIMALVSSVPVEGADGRAGVDGPCAAAVTMMLPAANIEIFPPECPVPRKVSDVVVPPAAEI